MKLGFIGTGAITEAVVTGLCKAEDDLKTILLSPRNAARAAKLADRYENVTIAQNNQAVIDGSDVICLAVRPQVAEDVLTSLTFRDGQQVISFIATITRDKLAILATPASVIGRVIPLPPVVDLLGPVAISPANSTVEKLFGQIGRVVVAENDQQLHALWSVTSLMAPYFALMGTAADWLRSQGIQTQQADHYIGAMFHALGHKAMTIDGEGFEEITVDHSTPLGLNEQALRELKTHAWLDHVRQVLDLINKRMDGHANFDDKIENQKTKYEI